MKEISGLQQRILNSQGWFIQNYLYAWAGVLIATWAANFTIHRCSIPFRSLAKTAVFEQFQPANGFSYSCFSPKMLRPQNCCKLVSLLHYKEKKYFVLRQTLIRLFDVLLFCSYIYSIISNSLVYRSKVTVCSRQTFLI